MQGRQLPVRLATAIALSLLGCLAGRFDAWIVWNFIYGIGGRVITDKLYVQLEADVVLWGGIAGACSGFAAGSLPGLLSISGLLIVTFASVVLGMVGGSVGWRQGLIGYFGTHAVAAVVCGHLAIARSKQLETWLTGGPIVPRTRKAERVNSDTDTKLAVD